MPSPRTATESQPDISTAPRQRCAVIGSPIAHSWSPVLHQAAYAWLGLDWEYGRQEVSLDGLAAFRESLTATWRGLSCTSPLKPAVAQWGEPDEVVRALGVANTVVFDDDPRDPATTRVANTDVAGLIGAIRTTTATVGRAVVIGSGATATSAVYALAQLGAGQIGVVARNQAALAELQAKAAGWGSQVVAQSLLSRLAAADIVISTIPAPAAAELAMEICGAGQIVFDVLYHPWPTGLLTQAQALGRTTLSGFDLLAHQAVGQVELMTGQAVPVEVLQARLPDAGDWEA